MAVTQFYPSLSTLLPLESIPPNLGFFQGVLQEVFDNLFFGELINRFHGSAGDPIQEFVDAYNLENLPAVPLTKLNDPDPVVVIEDLLGQFGEAQEVNVYELVFAAYLNLGTTVENTFAQISA